MSQPDRPAMRAARPSRWISVLSRVVLLLLVFCLCVVATAGLLVTLAPVTIVTRSTGLPPQVEAVYGTLRSGRAELVGGYVLSWQTQPRLAPAPGLGGTLRLTGPDTQLDAQLNAQWRRLGLSDLSGRAGPGLAALVPGAWDCAMTARVDAVTLLWRGAAAEARGNVALPAGACTKGGTRIEMPAQTLVLTTEGSAAVAVLGTDAGERLATLRLDGERRAQLSIAAAAAAVYPALPGGGPIEIDYAF